ncbi:autotransporter assembly complex family protein [Lysobacter sp. LF1]|uniref:Translocation and assembly module subunit TamA n=1 Tax=Lysobacter stagni TaxID=3045172 RepID=A0ABT6XDG2_9GAMM|nr:autotransporter assembly complex family protein [Lysobacter sp. LF1]MDI9238176.1 autotransporter assembly complex family protein [Lysobacter sp. LF1]
MPTFPRVLATAAFLLTAAGTAEAAKVVRVDIHGLDEAETTNVRGALSVVDAIGQDVPGRRLGYLVREAEDETREALEPFGFYSPKIVVERSGNGDTGVTVTITVTLDEPVRVRRADIAIIGEGNEDRYLKQDLAAFRPQVGDIFNHELYEASKTKITRRLAERGYFDADFSSRRVEVTRAERAADIDLVWSSGGRYDMGPINIEQTPHQIIRRSLLDKLIYWDQGSYYHQGKLDRFRESLARLDYFSSIEIEPRPEDAVDNEVPVNVTLTPAKRTIYTAGLSYGTDSGPGVRLGMERRYVNDRGHKALGQIDWASKRKTATAQYRIPAFAWLDGWYTFSAQYYDEQTDYMDTNKVELVASRSGQINRRLNAVASLHALRERWAYATVPEGTDGSDPDDDTDDEPVFAATAYNYATFLYPSLRAEFIDADDRIFPRHGIGITVEVRGGLEGLGSDANFAQAWGVARWYQAIGDNNRLIVRGEVGGTFTNALVNMPPSLRFFAGGDRSIRGYAFREVGPSTIGSDGKKYALGAKNVLTGSAEFEHYFNDTWGAAVFVDAGDAFNKFGSDVTDSTDRDQNFDLHTGVGIGVRWRSPVGPVRVDIARGLNDPDSDYEIYLNIGADW